MVEKKEEEKVERSESEAKMGDANALVAQFQMLQQRLQSVLMQKETFNINKMEIERAVEELEKTKEKMAYKITGTIMVSKPVDELKKDLESTKEAVVIRLKSLETAEKQITQHLKDLQEKLKKIIK